MSCKLEISKGEKPAYFQEILAPEVGLGLNCSGCEQSIADFIGYST